LDNKLTKSERLQKIRVIFKAVKWITWFFMEEKKHKVFETSLDAGEILAIISNIDSWSYEIIFVVFNILITYCYKKLFAKKQ
jgi:hypothetical protein